MDHFTSADLAKIVDDLRRWVIAGRAAEAAASRSGHLTSGPERRASKPGGGGR